VLRGGHTAILIEIGSSPTEGGTEVATPEHREAIGAHLRRARQYKRRHDQRLRTAQSQPARAADR
jgi:hypothetical protein